MKEEILYLMTHSTHFITVISILDILCHIDGKAENLLYHYVGYSFQLTARDLLHALSHNRIIHITTFGKPVVGHWLEWKKVP